MRCSDVDRAGDPIDHFSTTGYCTSVVGNLITWRCKQQNIDAQSNAKYKAIAHTICELMLIQSLLSEMCVIYNNQIVIYCDNQVAMYIANNLIFHE